MTRKRIHLIAGARPNFMKVAPLYHALMQDGSFEPLLIHTGQHYDPEMSDVFLKEFRLPQPHFSMGVGSGTHAEQTAKIMIEYEKIATSSRPDLVVVVGDVNSTLACSITAKKLHLRVAHLEAGLRSRDREMPEEINRLVTDSISDYLWTPSPDADENLKNEGVSEKQIRRVGNIMIDAFEMLRKPIEDAAASKKGDHLVVTLHRPSNVDDANLLSSLAEEILELSKDFEIVFPVHPRTRTRLAALKLDQRLADSPRIRLLPPQSYIDFMALVLRSRGVVTDSGGIQEESSYLGVPCFTLRENTERPITVSLGTNRLIPPRNFRASKIKALLFETGSHREIPLWDGNTALRIVAHIHEILT